MFNPFANFQQTMQLFNQFRGQQPANLDGRAKVQEMLNSGQMSQDQLNAIMPMAQQMYQMMFGGKK